MRHRPLPHTHFRKAFLVFALLAAAFAESATASPPKYILFITADGFRTDYIEWYHPTNLTRMISEGARVTHVTNVFPTVTTPNMTSLVTGALPRTTGVACNSQYLKEEDKIVQRIRDNKAETIAEMLHKAGWKTAGVNHFMLQNRGTDYYEEAGYDESEKTTDAVLGMFRHDDVRFVGVIYGSSDHAGHAHGPQSEQVREAVLSIDRAIGRLVEGLKQMGIYDQTAITFNADHGMSAFEAKGVSIAPAKALRNAGFKVATSQEQLKPDTQIIVLAFGAHLVYFRGELSEEERERATGILKAIEGAEVLDRKRLDALGCHNNRSGDLIVSPLPGYTITNAGMTGGQHGRFAERNPILFFRGPGFIHGTIEGASTIDVVPTLLHLVNVPAASTVDGHVIAGVLEQR